MYAQWLPLYQLTKEEFSIIAHTMQEVFPTVSIWRGNFSGNTAVVALVGHQSASVLSPDAPLVASSILALREHSNGQGDRVPLMAHYAGTLRADDTRLSSAPLNTDSHRRIEYLAPINHRREKAGKVDWFIGQPMLSVDPFLLNMDSAWHEAIRAGYYLQASFVAKDQGHEDIKEARRAYRSQLKKAAAVLK